MRRVVVAAAGAALLAAGYLLFGNPQGRTPPLAAGGEPVTVLVTFGIKATAAERWDGSAEVTGGRLISAAGRHFSEGDAITGPGAWKCVTRRDEVAPFADVHYTEMRPGSKPPVLFQPVGIYLTVEPAGDARVKLQTTHGAADFALSGIGWAPKEFLGGRMSVARTPAAHKLTGGDYEDDEPSIAALPDGQVAVAWVAYRDGADRVLLRLRRNGAWSPEEEVTARPGDLFRSSLAVDSDGNLWVFWSERQGERWRLWGRQKRGSGWRNAERLSEEGTDSFHRAAGSGRGPVFVVWQSFRNGQSDIFLKTYEGGRWSAAARVSESPANDWEPAVATGADGSAHIVWDGYDKGDYDIFYRSWSRGALSSLQAVTRSAKFQAHATVAVDQQNRPWVAWNESGVNWGKDVGFLLPVPLAVPLHHERTLRVAAWDGRGWQQPKSQPAWQNSEHPQLQFDGKGSLAMVFRQWTRRNARTIGSPICWENYLTLFDGSAWSAPVAIAASAGSIEKHAALTRDVEGRVWAAWMTDGRPFQTQVPANADVYAASLGPPLAASVTAGALEPFSEPFAEVIPVHTTEAADVQGIRAYTMDAGGKRYRIYRGDMHRHTDVSQDFKYDGSLLEVYRYALDAAAFDYIAPTDHQTGYDQEFTWWQNQKLVDLFFVSGRFTPLFAYERSLPYPNGHRNIVFAQRGVRTLPVPDEERTGRIGAASLFAYLHKNRGISMPHSSATSQGTNWRDNDPEVEPLMEIYQGYRNSYEYEGAPRAASEGNPHAQKSGWQPEGFWWKALAKGYKLGVQASSDHWSTHISYACILADNFTREGLLDAIRKRHAYGATDNIVLDFRAHAGEATYIMGDAFSAPKAPRLTVRATGTGIIKQVDLIKGQAFVYTMRPGAKEARFEYTDQTFGPGEAWYYVRVLQEDGQLAWSSPIWVTRR